MGEQHWGLHLTRCRWEELEKAEIKKQRDRRRESWQRGALGAAPSQSTPEHSGIDYSFLGCPDLDSLASRQPTFPSDRAETQEEALKHSLLAVVSPHSYVTSSLVYFTRATLDELFCRDVEAFSEVFDVSEAIGRPPSCPPLVEANCATLYDR